MRLIKIAAKLLAALALLILVAALIYSALAAFAYRDIDRAALIGKYGDANVQSVMLDGVSLHYRLDGDPLAPALLLIHSHYFDSRMWDDWTARLAGSFYVVRFDMTSHGLTGPEPDGDYSMTRDLELIRGLLAHLQLDRVAVAGSSLGGNMAFHLAAQADTPVHKLVLINSGGLPKAQSSNRNAAAIPDWAYKILYLVPTRAWRAFIEWMVIRDDRVDEVLVQRFHDMQRHTGNRQAEMQRMASFDAGDPYPVLARITQPTLILWGEDNPQLPVTQMDALAAAMPNAVAIEKFALPGVGHLLPVEAPEAAQLVEKFLQRRHVRSDD